MPSQRHFLYLLPRADPDELQEVIATREGFASNGLKVLHCLPLQLQVRIPPRPPASASSASPSTTSSLARDANGQNTGQAQCLPTASQSASVATTSSSTSTSTYHGTVNCGEGGRPTSGQKMRRASASVVEKSSRTGTNSFVTSPSKPASNRKVGLGHPLSPASSSTPAGSTSSQSSSSSLRNSKHHFISWKLVAPQVKTLSSSPNTYLLCEEFRQTELMSERASNNLSTKASQAMSTIEEKSSTSGVEDAAAKSNLQEAIIPSGNSGASPTSQRTNRDDSGSPQITRDQPPVPPPPMMQRSLSMSTFSEGSTLAGTLRNGKRWTPLAYRREMESVLFAQSSTSNSSSSSLPPSSSGLAHTNEQASHTSNTFPSSSASSSTSAFRRAASASNDSGFSSCSGSVESDKKHFHGPPITSTSSTHIPSSNAQNPLRSSMPFFINAPILYDETSYSRFASEADPLYMGRDKVNVCHVSDLDWYLEKLLWKLGMHRKGRKEFLSVSSCWSHTIITDFLFTDSIFSS